MNGRYRITPRARRDLDDIYRYTIENWGEAKAETYIRELARSFKALADGSLTGQSAHTIRPGYWRLSVGSHVVFHRRDAEDRVEIVRILHGRMDFGRYL